MKTKSRETAVVSVPETGDSTELTADQLKNVVVGGACCKGTHIPTVTIDMWRGSSK